MNNKTGLILRLILGGYLVFLGVSVIVQAAQTEPSDLVIKALFGLLFIVVGSAYVVVQIKKVYQFVKKETKDMGKSGADDSTQPLFEKPRHDEALYRTAPMPSEEISKKASPEVTDLRENMKYMKETPEQDPEKEQESQNEEPQLTIHAEEKQETPAEKKDPVNLAIEIMRDEEKESEALAEADEELEKDYEEK